MRGTLGSAYMTLLRARQAFLEGLEDQECMLTPNDTDLIYKHIKDCKIVLRDIEKASAAFGTVSAARLAITT